MPSTMSSATASGVVENGAGSIPSVIFVFTKPGRTIDHLHPGADEPVGEALGVARRARPWSSRRRRCRCRTRSPATDDSTTISAVALRLHAGGRSRRGPTPGRRSSRPPHRPRRRDRSSNVSWSPSTPNAESTRSTSPCVLEHLADHLRVGGEVRGRRMPPPRPSAPRPVTLGDERSTDRPCRRTGEDDGPAAVGDQPTQRGRCDLGAATEHERRLHATQRVPHPLLRVISARDRAPRVGPTSGPPIRNLAPVSTRMLIILAVICGVDPRAPPRRSSCVIPTLAPRPARAPTNGPRT